MSYPEATNSSSGTEFSLGNPVLPEPTSPEPTEKLSVIAGHIQSRFQLWRNARTQLERKWLAYYRQWRCVADAEDANRQTERSQIKMPATKEAVTNYVTAMLQIIFASEPHFDLRANHSDNRRPERLKAYISWLMKMENYRNKVKLQLTEQAIYGTSFKRVRAVVETKQRIVTKTQTSPFFNALTNQIETTTTMGKFREETDFTRPRSEPVSIYNLYVNPTATNVQNAEGVIIRSMKNRSDLELMLKEGIIEVLPSQLKEHWSGPTIESTDTLQRRLSSIGVQTSSETDQVEFFEAMIWIPPEVLKNAGMEADPETADKDINPGNGRKPYGGKELHVFMANGTILNPSSMEPPYGINERPISQDWFEQVPGEFYGIGIAEIAAGPQKALDATIRCRIDNKAIAINQLFAADRRKLTSGQDLGVYPGKIFLTEGPPGDIIQQFPIQDVTAGTYQDAAEYERYIQNAHGVRATVGGGTSKRGEQTATEVSNLLGQAMGIIKEMASNFEDNVTTFDLRWYARVAKEFPNPREEFIVVDPATAAVTLHQIESADVTGDYDFIPLGVITMNKMDRVQKIMQFLAATANPIDGPLTDRRYLLQEAWKGMNLGLDVDRVIPAPQQAIQQAQMQALPQAIGANVQGGPSQAALPSSHPGTQIPVSAPGGTPNA